VASRFEKSDIREPEAGKLIRDKQADDAAIRKILCGIVIETAARRVSSLAWKGSPYFVPRSFVFQ
jgi:hypothetical protein